MVVSNMRRIVPLRALFVAAAPFVDLAVLVSSVRRAMLLELRSRAILHAVALRVLRFGGPSSGSVLFFVAPSRRSDAPAGM